MGAQYREAAQLRGEPDLHARRGMGAVHRRADRQSDRRTRRRRQRDPGEEARRLPESRRDRRFEDAVHQGRTTAEPERRARLRDSRHMGHRHSADSGLGLHRSRNRSGDSGGRRLSGELPPRLPERLQRHEQSHLPGKQRSRRRSGVRPEHRLLRHVRLRHVPVQRRRRHRVCGLRLRQRDHGLRQQRSRPLRPHLADAGADQQRGGLMAQVCVSENMDVAGGVLAIQPWSVPYVALDAVFNSTGDGAYTTPFTVLPGKLMIDSGVQSWTNPSPLDANLLFRIQRAKRSWWTSNPNAVQVRDKYTYTVDGGTPRTPDTSSTYHGQSGSAGDVGADSAATPNPAVFYEYED